MLLSDYKLLFSVRIDHSYFYKEAESTKDVLARFKIMVRQDRSGLAVFCTAAASLSSVLMTLKNATGISSFDFDFNAIDSDFHLYTEIPDNFGQLVYSSANLLNRNEKENIVLLPTFIDERNKTKLGQLHLQFTDLIEFCKESNPVNFIISFSSRSIQWHYCIVNSSNSILKDLSIASSSNIKFSSPKNIILGDGQNATLFKSESLIPLRAVPEQVFALKNGGTRLIPHLPTPDIHRLYLDQNNGKGFYYSQMVVYL